MKTETKENGMIFIIRRTLKQYPMIWFGVAFCCQLRRHWRHFFYVVSQWPSTVLFGQLTSRAQLLSFCELVHPVAIQQPLIRLGGPGDGGYLVPDDLDGIVACFSPGVGLLSAFEGDLADRGIPCFLADYSVDAPEMSHPLFDFEKKYVGPFTNGHHVSMMDWVAAKAPPTGDLILQMDIEGAEYPVLLSMPDALLARFRVVVLECHGLDQLSHWMGYGVLHMVFTKLAQHFDVVHGHPNNGSRMVHYDGVPILPVMELTFLRKDRTIRSGHSLSFPHPLDAPIVPSCPDVALPPCWFQSSVH